MKNLFFISALCLALLAGCSQPEEKKTEDNTNAEVTQNFNLDTNNISSGETFYQCPMDPEVISDQPGQCPVCEMDLEPVVKS